LQKHADDVPPVDAKAVHNAPQAGFKQRTPNLHILDFDSQVENAEHWAAQRGTLFVIKRFWGSSQIDRQVPTLTSPRAVEVIVGM
jgi:hypothetical protein